MANHRTNAGFVAWADRTTPSDANIVKSLETLGAIVFARTNQPQSFMQLETSNNIYGVTVHPMNRSLTAGGSSGGESALMILRGTPLGFGGDIGGSIRGPASFSGVSEPKTLPTSRDLSLKSGCKRSFGASSRA